MPKKTRPAIKKLRAKPSAIAKDKKRKELLVRHEMRVTISNMQSAEGLRLKAKGVFERALHDYLCAESYLTTTCVLVDLARDKANELGVTLE